jgi:hypothetical protein
MPELRVETIGEEHIEPYVRLARAEYGDDAADADPRHVRWKFLENPQGASVGLHLYQRGDLVGRLAAMPRRFLHCGKAYLAAYLVDLVVAKRHRGMGSLYQLVDGLKRISGFDFVVVTPNETGSAVWGSFAKLPAQFEFRTAAVPLKPRKLLANGNGREALPFLAPLVDRPWQALLGASIAHGGGLEDACFVWPAPGDLEWASFTNSGEDVFGERTPAFLEWRYRQSPVWQYEVGFLRNKGRIVGYFVTRRTVYRGYDCRFIVDAFGGLGRRGWAAVLAGLVSREIHRGTAAIMLVGNTACGSFSHMLSWPLVSVASRFLPRPATVFAKWLSAPRFAFRPESFYLTLGDCDLV